MGWCSLAADGVSGGILILWDSRVLEMVGSCVSYFSVLMDLKNVEDGVSFFFGGYGPNDDSKRRFLWEELAGVCAKWNLP